MDRLHARGYTGRPGGVEATVRQVLTANRRILWNAQHPNDPVTVETAPTADDHLDALSLMAAWRVELDRAEQQLIDAARAAGATWEQIGLVLGYTANGAKQGACQRRKRLAEARPVP